MTRLFLILCLVSGACTAIVANAAELPAPLFRDNAIFEMRMEFEYGGICLNPVEQQCEDVPGVITYEEGIGAGERIEIRLRTRGRWRKETSRCEFPALFVFFDEQTTAGTVFEGEPMLPLTTHCKHRYRNYTDYLQTEYLAHRIYELLTEKSLRTRLMRVKYADSGSRMSRKRYAFFVEHFDKFGERTSTDWVKPEKLNLGKVRAEEMATLSLFQFMIGNLDWSALSSHNVALFEDEDGMLTPVPYDFDYAGIVYTPYATPPSQFPVYSVTTRYFRGFCWPDIDWQQLFDKFRAIEDRVFDELDALPKLSRDERRRVKSFLRDFYEILDTESLYRAKIIGQCRELPESLADYTIVTEPG